MPSSRKNKRTKKSSILSIPTADRISEFPEPILCHILSFLTTKQAATTSVLSKRWKTLWLSVFTLDFNYETFKDFNSFHRFVDSTMFSLRDNKIPIQSFSLKCGRSSHFTRQDYNRIFKCEMLCGVQNLNFDLSGKIRLTNLPPRIFRLKMLQVLKLMNVQMENYDQVDFPHLKILHLKSVYFRYRKDIVKFLLGCPILEDLQYSHTPGTHSFLNGMTMENLTAFPNLVKVGIFNRYIPMTLICNAKILHMEEVVWMTWTKLPMFHNLTHLELHFKRDTVYGYHTVYGECKSLLGILPHVPKLQHFKIQDCYGALSKVFDGWTWNDPPIVSECLSSQLKTCCINGYRGSEFEFGLAKYIMQHSKVLETMTINKSACCYRKTKRTRTCYEEKHILLLKLYSCTRGSVTCKLLFDL